MGQTKESRIGFVICVVLMFIILCCNVLMSKYVGFWNKMLQNTDSSSLKKKKSNIYTHGNKEIKNLLLN